MMIFPSLCWSQVSLESIFEVGPTIGMLFPAVGWLWRWSAQDTHRLMLVSYYTGGGFVYFSFINMYFCRSESFSLWAKKSHTDMTGEQTHTLWMRDQCLTPRLAGPSVIISLKNVWTLQIPIIPNTVNLKFHNILNFSLNLSPKKEKNMQIYLVISKTFIILNLKEKSVLYL
jgi:hypothetical protein